eukprot:TRINITY_DN49382_c0_g1_i1.p1 TRINITY_DN49382_c0_g1~~TRINITY_DN49382_c0_g1_i1.p1  ORF type:complete len:260 (+),score=11.91 TRINITY_DN49382_c0_g1_i1:92-781(+)
MSTSWPEQPDTSTVDAVGYAFHYVVPILSSIAVYASPVCVFVTAKRYASRSSNSSMIGELQTSFKRPLSRVSLLALILSPVFLLSNFHTGLYLYAFYSCLLSGATLGLDKASKRHFWPPLCVWHLFNLINLLGGHPWPISPYSMGETGIVQVAYTTSKVCQTNASTPWCSEWWKSVQIIGAFIYCVLHIIGFIIVTVRSAKFVHSRFNGPVMHNAETGASFSSHVATPF